MLDVMKKMLEAGLGAIVVSQEKLKEITDELVLKGNLSKKEGNDFLKELIETGYKSQERLKSLVDNRIQKAIKEVGFASKEDIKILERKVAKLEAQLSNRKKKEPGSKDE